jgi:hypothetical protein
MKKFFEDAAMQNHPLRILHDFLETEKANETAKKYSDLRFVGYVLDITFDDVTIITSDPFKIAVGGVPRNSLLIMTPANPDEVVTPHFTLLRVLDAASTPLSKETQQTFFELQKKSMPELDVFTQSELQWGALRTEVLGMFYPNPDKQDSVEFSGDMNNFLSAHKYRVYSPTDDLLRLVINTLVPDENRFSLGKLRMTECRLLVPEKRKPDVDVFLSTTDFMATRTAMFGKTRLGKSNIVKLIAESLIVTTEKTMNVGQLIFDINGEYANDNPQDNNKSLRSVFENRCKVYALTKKASTPSEPLKLNFYEQPENAQQIIATLLEQDERSSIYIQSYSSVELVPIDDIAKLTFGSERTRTLRKVQMFWAILNKAGFPADENKLRQLAPAAGNGASQFNPGFTANLRNAAYLAENISPIPNTPNTLSQLQRELEVINRFRRSNTGSQLLQSSSGGALFEPDDLALLEFLEPTPGRAGASLLQKYRIYHDPLAGAFVKDILDLLDKGCTVILDLGNAHPVIMTYFSEMLSKAVFSHQVDKFSTDKLGDHYMQLYFEEAHNLFPRNNDVTTIYSRFAKEGAKYHIGIVYSTQSPSTINGDLLAQTENFFIMHMSSLDEVKILGRLNVAFENIQEDILHSQTPGYVRMLTRSNRFVVPVQAHRFNP